MTYYELIELYKNGKLDNKQKKQVEEDIERQDAIGEYLFEQDELSVFSGLQDSEGEGDTISTETERESEQFSKMIHTTIRKTFIKMGVIVGVTVLTVVCFIIFALPQIVDKFYYDPSEIVGSERDSETSRLSLDLAVYSELFLPGTYRQTVNVIGNGNGKYDITIVQDISATDTFTDVAGTVNKGRMILYDANLLTRPTGNAFVPADDVVNDHMIGDVGAFGSWEDALKEIQELHDDDFYIAYVTLSDVMDYSDFTVWAEKNNIDVDWCAICQKNKFYDAKNDETEYLSFSDFSLSNIGFIYRGSCSQLFYNTDKYPLLSQYDTGMTTGEEEKWVVSEDNMKRHVISMLRFMADETGFCKMIEMNERADDFDSLADNVEEYGLNIYGFAVVAQKDAILDISNLDEVAYIYTRITR